MLALSTSLVLQNIGRLVFSLLLAAGQAAGPRASSLLRNLDLTARPLGTS